MPHEDSDMAIHHIPDEELVCKVDGELSSQRAAEVEVHLESCWDCRARMAEIEGAIANFARAHHAEFDAQLPPIAGPRALLRARLGELASESRTDWWKHVFPPSLNLPRIAFASLVLSAIVGIAIVSFRSAERRELASDSATVDTQTAPNRRLTPGATRQITISEACSSPQEEVVGDVPVSLRRQVLQEYGIASARPGDYEIDYLIAPRLGGAEDIRNLWPEPYGARVWNARVKDALEERLHELVCSGQLDLVTAQHDIATDWIAAYKKYFHTSQPLPLSS